MEEALPSLFSVLVLSFLSTASSFALLFEWFISVGYLPPSPLNRPTSHLLALPSHHPPSAPPAQGLERRRQRHEVLRRGPAAAALQGAACLPSLSLSFFGCASLSGFSYLWHYGSFCCVNCTGLGVMHSHGAHQEG